MSAQVLPLAITMMAGPQIVSVGGIRDWMNSHSWVVNIAVYLIFVLLILA